MPSIITAMIGGITVVSFKWLIDSLRPFKACLLGNVGSLNHSESPALNRLFKVVLKGTGQAVMVFRADAGGQMDHHVFFLLFVGQQTFFQVFDFHIDTRSATSSAVD